MTTPTDDRARERALPPRRRQDDEQLIDLLHIAAYKARALSMIFDSDMELSGQTATGAYFLLMHVVADIEEAAALYEGKPRYTFETGRPSPSKLAMEYRRGYGEGYEAAKTEPTRPQD